MNTGITGLRKVSATAKEIMSVPFRMVSAGLLSLMTLTMTMAPTLCAKINTSLDLDALFGNVIEIIIKLAMYVGIAIAAGGVFSWLLAMKDDNAEGQSRAIRLIVIGGALIGFRVILQLSGIIS